ncbi:ATP-grasp domain-containing protein [Patescibacteria group bacterium]|nr:ATP-grasp domain-containing protein [Patescibacteria group bacterium]MBU1016163.1 ATP-grasp domain-containing protein [Patescibacteria group bacterium]MBU1684711.1 ATP-grasp domain-containing protein [Patescibacteria group bacterium]MBU1938896.1 ATP-grasp domain-containing protein [Patescibacteria group bacterium]
MIKTPSKKILIVTGSDYTDQVYQAFVDARSLGHRLYLLSDGSFEPKPGIFAKHFTYDLRKTKEVLDYMKNQPDTFDAVTIKTSEWLTPLTALLAKQYGCIGNDPKVAFNCRSKYHMRRELEKAGVSIPKFRLCRNFDELKSAIDEIGIPCVAKPVGGNASYGTFMVRHKEDLEVLRNNYEKSIDYLKKLAVAHDVFAFSREEMDLIGIHDHVDMVTDYLVEEFMEGPEISADSLTQDGRTTIMGVADQIRMRPPYFVQLAEKMPYVCPAKKQKEIANLVSKTVSAMNIQNSPAHTEIIFTSEGPKIVEIGCRIGGDNIHDSIFQTTGYNLMYEAIMIALGEKRNYDIQLKCHTAMEYLLPDRRGTVGKIRVPQAVRENPDITEISIECAAGDQVEVPPTSFIFLGYVCAKGGTPAEAQKNLKSALSQISINIQ